MNETKHTPGPHVTGSDLENCGGGANITATVRGETVRIGHTARVVHGGEELVSEREAIANARLFAAAADLLAALCAVVDWQGIDHEDDKGCPEDDTCKCPLVARVNAAINKAEGK